MRQELKLCPKFSMPQKKHKIGIRIGENNRYALSQVWGIELVVVRGWVRMGGRNKSTDTQVENSIYEVAGAKYNFERKPHL